MLRAALAALLLSAAPVLADGAIGIHDPYAIQAVPGAPTGSAFMLIHNHASVDDHLLSATSPAAERVEVHAHLEEDGVMRMRPVEEPLEVPAGGVALLKRGGVHLMFMGLTGPWEDGDTFPLTLTFEEAGEVTVDVVVDLKRLTEDAGPSADDMSHDDMDHGHMDQDAMEGMDHEGHGG